LRNTIARLQCFDGGATGIVTCHVERNLDVEHSTKKDQGGDDDEK